MMMKIFRFISYGIFGLQEVSCKTVSFPCVSQFYFRDSAGIFPLEPCVSELVAERYPCRPWMFVVCGAEIYSGQAVVDAELF